MVDYELKGSGGNTFAVIGAVRNILYQIGKSRNEATVELKGWSKAGEYDDVLLFLQKVCKRNGIELEFTYGGEEYNPKDRRSGGPVKE